MVITNKKKLKRQIQSKFNRDHYRYVQFNLKSTIRWCKIVWCQKVDLPNSIFSLLCLWKNIYQKNIFSQKKTTAVIFGTNHTWLMCKILNGQSKWFIGKPKVWIPATQPSIISTPPCKGCCFAPYLSLLALEAFTPPWSDLPCGTKLKFVQECP